MFLLVCVFIIVGDFIDAVPAIIIFMPIINKLTEVGNIKPLHMGVVIITTLVFGLITPPYGLSLLVASKYVGVGFGKAVVRSLPLYVVFLADDRLHRPVSRHRAVAAEAVPARIGRLLQGAGRHGLHLPSLSRRARSDHARLRRFRSAPFGVRPLTPHLGAEISGLDLARGVAPDDLPRALRRLPALPGAAVPAARAAAGGAGRVRAPLRRGAGARDDDVPRRRLPRALSALEPRRERQAERQASRQGHAGLAHRRLVAARHRPGDDHLRRDRPRDRRRDALLRHVRRVRAARATRGRRASPACAPSTTSTSRARAATATT